MTDIRPTWEDTAYFIEILDGEVVEAHPHLPAPQHGGRVRQVTHQQWIALSEALFDVKKLAYHSHPQVGLLIDLIQLDSGRIR